MKDLLELLSANTYPGRGIVMSSDRIYYFIMGRSENSRNRVFAKTRDGIRTQAYNPTRLSDPSLIIYRPVARLADGSIVVTNGDQTDTICAVGDFRRALMSREYEPDAPNYTPRISAIRYPDRSFEISILKHLHGQCLREFFCYPAMETDRGYFISTYQKDAEPLPSFSGEPVEVNLPEPEKVWQALNADNRVSLYALCGSSEYLFNKNLGD